ncbi:MAG TPA: DNA methyltransferase [Elusimicrobiales bacterium]|nr:DNA methyltransferase [Elusimicrobiales bacterium]
MKKYLNKVNCADCLEFMKGLPDNSIDLILADPPYFSGPNKSNFYGKNRYKKLEYWDIPKDEHYNEMLRVSKNQIIFGINYFEFSNKIKGRLVWDKKNDTSTFSNCEIASCSYINSVKIYRYTWNGFIQENMKNKEKRVHPTQKPVQLIINILKDFTKKQDIILDLYSGSGSISVACKNLNRNFIGCELSKEYCNIANERIKNKYEKK